MQTLDHKMFLDMQEHPEKYSEQQIEATLDELDQTPDVEAAWQKFSTERCVGAERTRNYRQMATHPWRRWQKVAASFAGIVLATGLVFAAFRLFSPAKEAQPTEASVPNPQPSALSDSSDALVLFADIRLDSMLVLVGKHYGKAVLFCNEEIRGLRIHTKWNRKDSLAAFINNLNELDELQLTELRDTIFVQKGGKQ